MQMLRFLKQQWNLVASFSVMIVVFLTKIIVPPRITLYAAAGDIDYTYMARFMVIAVLLILLFPFYAFNKKIHAKIWWMASLGSIVAGIYFFFSYLNFTDRKTGYNSFAKTKKVVGDHLLPLAKIGADSIRINEKLDSVTPDQIVEFLGEPEKNYPIYEIVHNSNVLLIRYSLTIFFTALFIVFSIQSIYCSQNKT